MSQSNPPPIIMNGVKLSGGMQILNYNTFTPPVYFNFILDDMDNVLTTEDQQYGFVTEN
jgi:hypothetical protein